MVDEPIMHDDEPFMFEGEPLTNERAEKIADEILAKFDAMSDEERRSRMRPPGTMKRVVQARRRVLQALRNLADYMEAHQ